MLHRSHSYGSSLPTSPSFRPHFCRLSEYQGRHFRALPRHSTYRIISSIKHSPAAPFNPQNHISCALRLTFSVRNVSHGSPDHEGRSDDPIVIGNPLANSPPDFPPLQTVHERFHSHGFPSFTNCYSNQQQVSCCSNVIASIPANFLSLFSLSSCCLFSCTVCMIAEIVPFCVA